MCDEQKTKRQKRHLRNAKYRSRAKRIVQQNWAGQDLSEAEFNRFCGSYYHQRAQCSCVCCGNPRRNHGGRTLKEKSSLEFHDTNIRW